MTPTLLRKSLTFGLSFLLGTGAAVAVAATPVPTATAASKAVPVKAMRPAGPSAVIRLEPVLVTISSSRFHALKKELACETEVAANPPVRSRG